MQVQAHLLQASQGLSQPMVHFCHCIAILPVGNYGKEKSSAHVLFLILPLLSLLPRCTCLFGAKEGPVHSLLEPSNGRSASHWEAAKLSCLLLGFGRWSLHKRQQLQDELLKTFPLLSPLLSSSRKPYFFNKPNKKNLGETGLLIYTPTHTQCSN